MNQSHKKQQRLIAGLLATTLVVSQFSLVFADPINSVNTGSSFTGGNYLNTAGNQTIFRNPGAGMKITGKYDFKESDNMGNLTGNGGAALFQARSVVFDGARLDARSIMQNGRYVGNGGKITVQADLFYSKNSDIMVGGANGGMFTASVGNFFTKNTNIDATGNDGHGGIIKVNASGTVNIDKDSKFDATQNGALYGPTGDLIGTFDPGLIDISGSAVNVDGILRADAASAVAGGKVNLVATGNSKEICLDCDETYTAAKGIITEAESKDLIAISKNLREKHAGSIRIGSTAKIQANGLDGIAVAPDGYIMRASHGGNVDMTAVRDIKIEKGGLVQANGANGDKAGEIMSGGDGGFIKLNAQNQVSNAGTVQADGGNGVNQRFDINAAHLYSSFTAGGNGGNGGAIVVSGKQATNTGLISAKGGYGGNGGDALAYASDYQNYANANAQAKAEGGNGYRGGNGGLVVFNTEANPNNVAGTIDVSGGAAGNGGNATAQANAYSYYGDANAEAIALAGHGGQGGNAGTIVVKNPGQLNGTLKLNGGQSGNVGYADAQADAFGYNHATSNAVARGNSLRANADDSARANSTAWYSPTGAAATADWTPGIKPANGTNGVVDALRPVEIVSHNGQAIILNNGVTGNTTLQHLITTGNVRTTQQQLGGAAYPTAGINSIHVGDIASSSLGLNPGAISGNYPNAKHVVINAKGDLTNGDNITTNSIWLLSGGKAINSANIVTADSVNISAKSGVINSGLISSGTTARGGSVIISNAEGAVRNTGIIAADSTQYGGRVDIRTPGLENANGARISADAVVCDGAGNCSLTNVANASGGQVVIRGTDLINHGVISGSQINPLANGIGVGGEVRMYADNFILNSKTGVIKAVGQNNGGDIKLAAAAVAGNNGFGNAPIDGLVFKNGVYPVGNNPVAGQLTPNKPGVVINEGTVAAIACESCNIGQDGSVTLVGDNGVIMMQDSYLNRVLLDAKTLLGAAYGNPAVTLDPTVAANIQTLMSTLNSKGAKVLIAAGEGAAKRIICLHDPRNPNPPQPPSTPNNPDGPDVGNFLRGRDPFDTTPRVGTPTPISVANCGLFLAKSFEAVTTDILSRSYDILSNAGPQQAIEYLMQSGMTCCAAGELANRLRNGQLNLQSEQADQSVSDLLTVIGNTCQTQPCGTACSTPGANGTLGGGCCTGSCNSGQPVRNIIQ